MIRHRTPESYDDEQPLHSVPIRDFSLAKYPVTVAEYHCAVDAGVVSVPDSQVRAYKTKRDGTGPDFQQPLFLTWEEQQTHPDFPVRALKNWFEAYQYAQWVAAPTGKPWRLPTEAEWEKAAKGPENRRSP